MRIGSSFNPYRVFQGVFAPYWILEHRGIGTGAKLCYIRLLGFAGKDARCYPSLDTLGKSLGVSDRQARDYVKELERAGLIVAEQRGLRRTNVYSFLWTAELEKLIHSVPDGSDDPGESPNGPIGPPGDQDSSSGLDRNHRSAPDRNHRSAPDRNRPSVPDRNDCSVLERKLPAGPIGINSVGINSLEISSSPSALCQSTPAGGNSKTTGSLGSITEQNGEALSDTTNRTGQAIIGWARARNLQRIRSDRQLGLPEKEHVAQWTSIFEARGVADDEGLVYSVLDMARDAANRFGQWRNWAFITLQIQLAAEQLDKARVPTPTGFLISPDPLPEEADSVWAKAKARIGLQISEIAYQNWFVCTRQIEKFGSRIEVAVPDEHTMEWLKGEYKLVIGEALSSLGVEEIRFVVCHPIISGALRSQDLIAAHSDVT